MFAFFSSSIARVFNAVVFICMFCGLSAFAVAIGWYNYDTTMKELRAKALSRADLAAFSLKEPLWNYDDNTLQDIFKAVLLDSDFVAIRVRMSRDQKVISEKKIEALAQTSFEEMAANPMYLSSITKIKRENEHIADVQIVTSVEKAQAVIRYTTWLILAFALGLIATMAFVMLVLGNRVLKRPIDALRESADRLAQGHLDTTIDTQRKDELGSLAGSFDRMRNAIRKKLADLAILNDTGEKLASIHNQLEALETAIRVMSEQTHVERGSIYLLDAEGKLNLHAYYPKLAGPVNDFPKSFRLDEGVAGRVARSGEIVFIPDVSRERGYVAQTPHDRPVALLCVPMFDDKNVFGVMNFIGEVGKVAFEREDEGFALTVARMTVITTKNIQMLEVIEQQNHSLEEKILERTAELRQKTNDISAMLQNMCQGIFTVVGGGVIHNEYSSYLGQIFETAEIAARPALSFLFEHSDVGADELNQMEATLGAMIGEDEMMFEFNSHLLTTEYYKRFGGERGKILDLDWNPVLDMDGRIDKVMVIVRDVTELKALQRETEKQKEELDIIGQILSISQKKFLEFLETAYEFIEENREIVARTTVIDKDVVAVLFRNMHTIKGNARTYGLSYITDQIHAAETSYAQIRSGEAEWRPAQLLEELSTTKTCIGRYETVFKNKLAGFAGGDGEYLDRAIVEKITQAIDEVNELSHANDIYSSLRTIHSSINAIGAETIHDVLKTVLNGVPGIARDLGKEAPAIAIADNSIRIKKEVVPLLRNVFMHAFRNSLDHGLETVEQRKLAGKLSCGQIALDLEITPERVTFYFSDDGRGLAMDAIHAKATELGILPTDLKASDERIAECVFHPGLSTAATVTSVSGRGVGMDAIRKFLRKQEGDAKVELTGGRDAAGYRPFRLVISLPARYANKQT